MNNKNITLLIIGCFVLFLGFSIYFIYNIETSKADPCSLCAKRVGETVTCNVQGSFIPVWREFYPNGSIRDSPKVDLPNG